MACVEVIRRAPTCSVGCASLRRSWTRSLCRRTPVFGKEAFDLRRQHDMDPHLYFMQLLVPMSGRARSCVHSIPDLSLLLPELNRRSFVPRYSLGSPLPSRSTLRGAQAYPCRPRGRNDCKHNHCPSEFAGYCRAVSSAHPPCTHLKGSVDGSTRRTFRPELLTRQR